MKPWSRLWLLKTLFYILQCSSHIPQQRQYWKKKKKKMWHSKCRVSSPFHPSVYTSRDLQKVFPMAFQLHCVYLKIWFDILTPKQVMFFRRAVNLLHNSSHEVLCTSRKYREAVELVRIKKLDLTLVGSHGGADRYNKLRESARRT